MLRSCWSLQGDEFKFLGLTDSIRKECRVIDKDMIGLPELRLEHLAIAATSWLICTDAPETASYSRETVLNASECVALCSVVGPRLVGSFDIMADWSSPGELFPGSFLVDSQELSMLLLEINSGVHRSRGTRWLNG